MQSRVHIAVVPHGRFPSAEVAHLRWRMLQKPFGVEPDPEWHDDDPNATHILATDEDGRAVGYVRLEVKDDGEAAHLRQLVVDDAHQRRGLGRALVETFESEARRRGMKRIVLEAREPAWGFYDRLGFETVEGPFPYGRTSLLHKRMVRPIGERKGGAVSENAEHEIELEFIEPGSELWPQAEKLRWDVLIEPYEHVEPVDFHDDDPHSTHVAAVEDGRVVGYARLIEQGDVGQIRHVTVHPDLQRSGLGTVMMAALVTDARNRGLRQVWLNSRMPAVPFYKRLGFQRVGDTFVTPVVKLEHVRMELDL